MPPNPLRLLGKPRRDKAPLIAEDEPQADARDGQHAKAPGEGQANASAVEDQERQERIAPAEKRSAWDKASVIVQGVGGLAIFVSLAALFIGVRQFNEQQQSNAAAQLNQQHQATLEQYLDDMSDLVLNHKLATAGANSATVAIAIARTATALRNLDGASKGILARFLWEAGLILRPNPILDLYDVDLSGAVFQNANLYRAQLSSVNLTGANFNGAQLPGADLSYSALEQSSMVGADLGCYSATVCTDLSGAYLMRADLDDANLAGADLAGADLDGANLSGPLSDLTGANFHGADYNVRPGHVVNAQGQPVINMPTQWPANFNPAAAGAHCDDC
jgi:uncharacterized protein YjbI with pentapeptide repeats